MDVKDNAKYSSQIRFWYLDTDLIKGTADFEEW